MKIVNRVPKETADVSAARGTAFVELRRLMVFTLLLAVGLYLGIGIIVDLVVACISFETEAKMFGSVSFAGKRTVSDNEEQQRVEKILERLRADPVVPPLPYRVVIMDSTKPNAFAFPGGVIGVTSELLKVLEEEVALAFVLGHELGHFHSRDHLRGMGRAVGVGVAFSIVFGGQMGDDTVGKLSHYVLQRQYSRQQEERADRFGVGLVYRVYGRTDGTDRLFKIFSENDKLPRWAYMFATHPAPEKRIRNLRAYADEIAAATKPTEHETPPVDKPQ